MTTLKRKGQHNSFSYDKSTLFYDNNNNLEEDLPDVNISISSRNEEASKTKPFDDRQQRLQQLVEKRKRMKGMLI